MFDILVILQLRLSEEPQIDIHLSCGLESSVDSDPPVVNYVDQDDSHRRDSYISGAQLDIGLDLPEYPFIIVSGVSGVIFAAFYVVNILLPPTDPISCRISNKCVVDSRVSASALVVCLGCQTSGTGVCA